MSGAVDFGYLETYTAGDGQVIAEVLALFQGQAVVWQAGLERPVGGWRDLIHAIKGAARGIGATALGDACETAEFGDPSLAPMVRAAQVGAALADALAAIEGYLAARAV